MSLHAVNRASVLFDPLDQAVEKLWLNGIVVVAAAGNYGTAGAPSGVPFAPGNDPFIITVGAADIGSSVKAGDDTVAPFSAYGYTPDGFMKPDIRRPRSLHDRCGSGRTRCSRKLKPTNVTDALRGYIQLSGTSLRGACRRGDCCDAAGPASGTGRRIRSRERSCSPRPKQLTTSRAEPRGRRRQRRCRPARLQEPHPNPNAGLDQFVKAAADGTNVFDPAAWQCGSTRPTRRGTTPPGRTRPGRMRPGRARHGATWRGPTRPGLRLPGAALAWSDVAWSDAAWATRPGLTTPSDAGITTGNDATQARSGRIGSHSSCAIRSLTQCSASAPGAGYLP